MYFFGVELVKRFETTYCISGNGILENRFIIKILIMITIIFYFFIFLN